MDIALLLLTLIVVKGMSVRKDREDYMLPAETGGVKGIFVFLVIFSHFVGYGVPEMSDVYVKLRSHLSQCVVVMFFFYSGYGMMEQMKKKDYDYVRTVPRRFLTVLINFDIAVALFALVQMCLGRTFSLSTYLLSLTGWDSLGNSNWYIFGILCLYAVTFVCFQPMRKSGKMSLYLSMGLMLAGSMALVVLIRALGKESWWYNTLLTFPLGMMLSLLRPIADRMTKTRTGYLLACSAVAVLYAYFSLRRGSLANYTLWTFLFAAAVILMSMRVQLRSPLLDYAGKHVFSIYILQRIPMICLKQAGMIASHPYLSLIITVVVTMLMAEVFDQLTGKLNRKLFGR